MPIVGHFAVGLMAGHLLNRGAGIPAPRAFLAGCALAVAPDLDLLAVPLGIPDYSPWAHRGASHSLAACVVVSLIFLAGAARTWRVDRWRLGGWAFLTGASHGLLDLLTDGSRVALFWPFRPGYTHIEWRPLPGVDNPNELLTSRALSPLGMDLLVFGPLALWVWWARRGKPRS